MIQWGAMFGGFGGRDDDERGGNVFARARLGDARAHHRA